MIQSKKELKNYLGQDAKMLDRPVRKPRYIHDDMWTYQILMRKCEYYINCRRDLIGRVWCKWLKYRYSRIARIRGFEIPFNTFGPGLAIAHCGSIVVNANARIGKTVVFTKELLLDQTDMGAMKHLRLVTMYLLLLVQKLLAT